ncbi:MAG: hypothetical protein ACI837_001152 [Crocinitomicaceae bacterium]|jgi:hypothetical protein
MIFLAQIPALIYCGLVLSIATIKMELAVVRIRRET